MDLDDAKQVAEPSTGCEINNLECSSVNNSHRGEVTESIGLQTPQTSGDADIQNSELPKDSVVNNLECNSFNNLTRVETSESTNSQNKAVLAQTVSDNLEKQNGNCNVDIQNSELPNDSEINNLECNSLNNSARVEVNESTNSQNKALLTQTNSNVQNSDCPEDYLHSDNLTNKDVILHNSNSEVQYEINTNNEKLSEAIVKITKPLCADYRSDSDSDSESDSSVSSTDTTTETSSESEDDSDDSCNSNTNKNKSNKDGRKSKGELTLYDLPPIEDLVISLPEEACVEIGTITSIVDALVVVESYKGSAALDVDTVLFLDNGKRTLGKVFDILGPITEPVYAVRFNSQEQIKDLGIEKGLKVYYAPKTQHTNFVFMAEVLKNRGSDASWKDNTEAPPEFQDFSDDEEERLHRQKHMKESENASGEQNKSRKRPFTHFKQNRAAQPNSFRNPNFSPQRRPNFPRHPPNNQFTPPNTFPRPNLNPYPYTVPAYRNPFPPTHPPHMYLPPRITGPPFPAFGGVPFVHQNQNFQQPFFQQRAHPQNFGGWGNLVLRPPPPPPPTAEQVEQQPALDNHS